MNIKEGKAAALRLVKDDYHLLQHRIERLLLNLSVPGSMDRELSHALQMSRKDLEELNPPEVNEEHLEEAVTVLVNMAFYTRELIDNSLVPGDMLEEAFNLYTVCKELEDRWIAKT